MPTFQTCAVVLTNNKEVYRKGENVSGSLILDVNEEVVVKAVRVYLRGEALAKWSKLSPGSLGGTEDFIAKEKYFSQVYTVFGKRLDATGPNHNLTSGRHKYNFLFKLNYTSLPSSYEGEYGGIRFWIMVEIDRPFPAPNQNWYRGITVIEDINVNEARFKAQVRRQNKKQLSKALGIGDAGTLTLTSATDRGAYCAGEKIALAVVVSNETSKDLGKLKAQLIQKVEFTAKKETKTQETIIRVLEGSPVMKGEERVWKDQLMDVDAIPPTTVVRSCKIVNVSYLVKVLVEVPLSSNIVNTMPITVGTIPFGHSPQTPRGAAAAAAPVEELTYTKCSHGFLTCRKSEGNFPNYSYIPMCAYVPNYVFPPPQRPTPPPASRQPAASTPTTTQTQTQAPRPAGGAARAAQPPAPSPAGGATRAAQPPAPSPAGGATRAAQPPAPSPAGGARPRVTPTPTRTHARAAAPPPRQPSAPPMELPPSYDEVLKMSNPAATNEVAIQQELAHKAYGVLLLRFPDSHVMDFRDTIQKERQSLAVYEGEVIAFAPQTIFQQEQWPSRTSVAIMKFASIEAATDWFNKTPGVADPNWLGSCDAMVTKMYEQYREANRLFSMSRSKLKKGATKAAVTKYSRLYLERNRPLRLRKTGVVLVTGKQYTTLRGQWLDTTSYFSVSQWEDLDTYFEYKTENKQGIYKEGYDLQQSLFDFKKSVIFQSEDLSPFQVTLTESVERSDSPVVEIQAEQEEPSQQTRTANITCQPSSDDQNETIPNQNEATNNQNEATPNQNDASPNQNEATPNQIEATSNEATPDMNEAKCNQNEATPNQNEEVVTNDEKVVKTDMNETKSNLSETTPGQNEAEHDQKEATPNPTVLKLGQKETTSDLSQTTDIQTEMMSEQMKSTSEQSEVTPLQNGATAYPDQTEITPRESEFPPERNEPTPEQGESKRKTKIKKQAVLC